MRARIPSQRGATLLISLVMLVVITLFVVSGIRLANVNLKVVGNYQWQKFAETSTNDAIEQVVSDIANFSTSNPDKDICTNGLVVAVGGCTTTNPRIGSVKGARCLASTIASGYSKKVGELSPDDNIWLLTATLTDTTTKASVRIHRGITVRQLAGSCP